MLKLKLVAEVNRFSFKIAQSDKNTHRCVTLRCLEGRKSCLQHSIEGGLRRQLEYPHILRSELYDKLLPPTLTK